MTLDLGGRLEYERGLREAVTVPLWHKSWWLDAATGGSWGALSLLKKGRLVAALPYTAEQWYGLTRWTQPILTQALGPWSVASNSRYVRALSTEHALLAELADAIPSNVLYRQNWQPQRTNWLPFHWRGFQQSTRYTYRIDLRQGAESAWRAAEDGNRNAARKARDRFNVKIEQSQDVGLLSSLSELTFKRQSMSAAYPREVVQRIFEEAARRDAATLWVAREGDGVASAAALVVRDSSTSYYLMGGADPELRASGSQTLLLWEAIKHEAGLTDTFDFEGSMVPGIERAFRSFGAVQTPYSVVFGSKSRGLRRLARVFPRL